MCQRTAKTLEAPRYYRLVFRDDKNAADALADSLRRENEELEDENRELAGQKDRLARENARLRAELATSREKPAPPVPVVVGTPEPPSENTYRPTSSATFAAPITLTARIVSALLTMLVTVPVIAILFEPSRTQDEIGIGVALAAGLFNVVWIQLALKHFIGPQRTSTGGAVKIAAVVLIVTTLTCLIFSC